MVLDFLLISFISSLVVFGPLPLLKMNERWHFSNSESPAVNGFLSWVYCYQVIIAGLWLYSTPILRWIMWSLHAVSRCEPTAVVFVGFCASAALEETVSSESDGHMFLQQFHAPFSSSDLKAETGLNLFETWRHSDGKVPCAAWESFTLLTLTYFFPPSFIRIFQNPFPLGGEN